MKITFEIGNYIRSEVWNNSKNRNDKGKPTALGYNPIPWNLFRLGVWMDDYKN